MASAPGMRAADMKQLPVRLDPAIYRWLRDQAAAEETQMVRLIREGIDMLIDQRTRAGKARTPRPTGQIPGQTAITFRQGVVDQ